MKNKKPFKYLDEKIQEITKLLTEQKLTMIELEYKDGWKVRMKNAKNHKKLLAGKSY